jgi:hypothetical protein
MMSEVEYLEKILRESFVACSPKDRSVRSFRMLCDIMPGDRERIADELNRLSRLEQAADAVISAKQKWGATTDDTHQNEALEVLVEILDAIDALAEAMGET